MKSLSEESKKKKFNLKLMIVLAVIVIAAIAIVAYSGIFSLPTTGLATTANVNTQTQEPPKFTTTGNEVVAEEVTQDLPYYVDADLEAGRYSVQVETDNPVWIRLYEKASFEAWQNTGSHGITKAGTNLGLNDKVTSFNRNFDVNIGEEGKYYLLILGSERASIKLKIEQILKF